MGVILKAKLHGNRFGYSIGYGRPFFKALNMDIAGYDIYEKYIHIYFKQFLKFLEEIFISSKAM
jgi:hypothetical protein